MRFAYLLIVVTALSFSLEAQQSSSAPQAATFQTQWRNLASRDYYVAADETIIDGKACHDIPIEGKAPPPATVFDLNPNGASTLLKIGAIPCPDMNEQAACDSFAELTRANDANVNAVVAATHSAMALSFVCFADYQNVFFTVRYGNTPKNPRLWWFVSTFYKDGVANSSEGLGVLATHLVSDKSEDTPPIVPTVVGNQSASVVVSDSELEITTNAIVDNLVFFDGGAMKYVPFRRGMAAAVVVKLHIAHKEMRVYRMVVTCRQLSPEFD